MTAQVYSSAKDALLRGRIQWDGGNVRCHLVTGAYAPNIVSDANVARLPPDSIIETLPMRGCRVDSGVARADGITFPSVISKPGAKWAVISAGDQLVCLFELSTGELRGNDVTLSWDKVFSI